MRKLFYLAMFIVFLSSVHTIYAQSNYISHTLKQGESLSALAKQYNTNVGDIMRTNGMHADTKLVYGSTIKIPANKKITAVTETAKPTVPQVTKTPANAITHKIAKGETLFSISKQYNVSVAQLKAWNNLADNSAKLGSVLIIQSDNNVVAASNETVSNIKRQRVETSSPIQQPAIEPAQKDETKNVEVVNNPLNNIAENKAPDNVMLTTNNATADTVADNVATLATATKNSEGYFADNFKKSRKQQHVSGISKIFKTASGWSDGKYYILADDINPGTIVKLTADNGSAVYAKVLWNMGNLKENNGVNFRVSNAAAAALNENADSFNLTVYY